MLVMESRRRRRGEPELADDAAVQRKRAAVIRELRTSRIDEL